MRTALSLPSFRWAERASADSEPVDLAPGGVLRVCRRATCFRVVRDFSLRASDSLEQKEFTNGVGDSVGCLTDVVPLKRNSAKEV